jgi:signal transduction histidine kinase
MVILIILFNAMTLDLHLIFKFLLIYFSFFIVTAIISTLVIRNDIDTILISTYDINSNYSIPKKQSKFSNELIYNLLPFFVVLVITIALLGYSKTSDSIGEGNYYYYKLSFENTNIDTSTIDTLKTSLEQIPLKNSSDYYFILNGDDYIFSNPEGDVSDFFIKYADTYLEKTDGRVYEYYGVEQEGYVQKVKLDNGNEVYVGFKYSTTSHDLINYFIYISCVSTVVYTLILILWSKNTSKNIREIADKLSYISEQKDLSKIDVLPLTSNDEIGQLTDAFNRIQITSKKNIETIKANQSQLVEHERLASLGQMVGGIAHNLKTPIMSISGAAEALQDLTTELDNSIGNPVVTEEDFHDIAKDYKNWISKIKEYTEYMSDVITAVKGQTVNLSSDTESNFTISELFKRVNILMRHELKNAIIYLNITVNMDETLLINGDVNILVQVINNMISNSIQAYNGKTEQTIELNACIENQKVVISIQDYAGGLPKKVKDKLFKEMITTKGKNGTGLGLYMSYSTIKAHFNGDITFESEDGKGTKFNIILPM